MTIQGSFSVGFYVIVLFQLLFSSLSFADDPFLWLEEVESSSSLNWVNTKTEKTLQRIKSDPHFPKIFHTIKEASFAKDRLLYPGIRNQYAYNFWQDEKNPRGIWRRTAWDLYQKQTPQWETVLDIDQISREEKEDWVWKGPECLEPQNERCLISLSRGGGDKVVIREFDLVKKEFVKGGFSLSEAKASLHWVDKDTVFVHTDFGPGSLTQSGYPRIAKVWKRGTPLDEAQVLFEGNSNDLSVTATSGYTVENGMEYSLQQTIDFYTQRNWILKRLPDGSFEKHLVPFPETEEFEGVFQGFQLAKLRQPLQANGKEFSAGSVVAVPIGKTLDEVELVFAPNRGVSVESVMQGNHSLLLSLLDNVKGKLVWITRESGHWIQKDLSYPDNGVVSVLSFDHDGRMIVSYEDFLTPTSLYFQKEGETFQEAKRLVQAPQRFDSSPYEVKQLWATSKDQTKVPYFLVQKRDSSNKQPRPTLLYGYGGFEVSQTPSYLDSLGKVWLDAGGVYVVANIRGGGEFGPEWHQAGIQENRQKVFDDFIAVAEHLIQTGVTSPQKLGIMGGSNGGLLVGATFVQRPDLFKAVVCQVPLLDMMRYHLLLAGDSWKAEYGDPDDPAMKEAILKYSPYQNLLPGKNYPKVLFTTSTKDDRVHPGHARKMAAKMESFGYDFEYYENTRGGHSGGADLEDSVLSSALEYTFLARELF